jgi:FemAB-related protein (PEP-CTERM system-associated)
MLVTPQVHTPSDLVMSTRRIEPGSTIPGSYRAFITSGGHNAMYCDPGIVSAIAGGLRQHCYLLEARSGERLVGLLPVVSLQSRLFGHFLVSVPYVSWAGPHSESPAIARRLVDQAIALADELDARFLELRMVEPISHPSLVSGETNKSLMRLALGPRPEDNWKLLKSEVRTQVRKAMKLGLQARWGGETLLADFYDVFARNMRDLGTPVFPIGLFRNILRASPESVEIGVVRLDDRAIAACLAVHGPGLTEIPSAAALRAYRHTAANSLVYWRAIERAIERKQGIFDFGRGTPGGSTFDFKRKWGAVPQPLSWHYYVRRGDAREMRPESGRFRLAIKVWQHLPISATRLFGPMIVRGIP